jgi:heat shock protein HspQ
VNGYRPQHCPNTARFRIGDQSRHRPGPGGEGVDIAPTFENTTERASEVVEPIKVAGRRAMVMRADSAGAAALTRNT